MGCIFRGSHHPSKINGEAVDLYKCSKFKLCTETDIGLTLRTGAKAGVCTGCPLAVETPVALAPTKKLTIGMATYRDWPGLWATIQSIRLNHPDCWNEIEIVVIDNDSDGNPNDQSEGSHSGKVRRLCDRIGATYEHFTAVSGTAAAKGRIFDLATCPAVMVIDCHVLFPAGVLRKLIDFFAWNPDSIDLWQGPCIGDGGVNDLVGTHFKESWGGLMYGQWAIDPRVYDADPFEIPMQGCGMFACNKAAWPGFHPKLRGFGPEEFHIHQRIRRKGGKCYCLPWLKWCHRFGNPDGAKVPGLHPEERLRGHLITHLDTGAPSLSDIRGHFVDEEKAITNDQFFKVLRDTVAEFWSDRTDLGADCPHRLPFLYTEQCQIGCAATRSSLPIFACAKHGKCSPWRWERNETMQTCLGCAEVGASVE